MLRAAEFSDDRVYRYRLSRRWPTLETRIPYIAVFIGLNPSTADENVDDPTIRRCIGFAQRLGCAGLDMLNLFAYRATDPKAMKAEEHPIEPVGTWQNDTVIREVEHKSEAIIIAAWGTHGSHLDRDREVMHLLRHRDVHCLGTTKAGFPRHPLYLRADSPLKRYNGRNL